MDDNEGRGRPVRALSDMDFDQQGTQAHVTRNGSFCLAGQSSSYTTALACLSWSPSTCVATPA